MPFPFTLPTTSATSFADYYNSVTHPSLPLAATTHRSVLRDALKSHKRLSPSSQPSHLLVIQDALASYLPYALTIQAALQHRPLAGDQIELVHLRQLELEWRPTLMATLPGREPPRIKIQSVHGEVAFLLQTLAYTHGLLARSQLFTLYNTILPTAEQRSAATTTAMKHLLDAHRIHTYAYSQQDLGATTPCPVDITSSTQSALASLALAEATLLVVQKDDPYAAAVAEDRNKASKDWMISAPSIPKVRAHLFARLCLAAADHAAQAVGLIVRSHSAAGSASGSSGKVDEELIRYVQDLRRTARAKAARFLGIDAEIAGKTGDGIAWLRGARKELGLAPADDEAGKRKGFKGLKQSWAEKREDRRVEKGGVDWGMDAGRLEEARVVEWLEARWSRMNDTVGPMHCLG